MPQTPRLRFIDFETTGTGLLDQGTEIAWLDPDTGERGVFIPPHSLDGATPIALEIQGYDERIKGQPVADFATIKAFHDTCGGDGVKTTLICANKTFDPVYLKGMFERAGLKPDPFTYRWFDIEDAAYWLFPDEFPYGSAPGLKDVARVCGVHNPNHHEAMNDVLVGVHCWRLLSKVREALLTTEFTSIRDQVLADHRDLLAPRA